MEEGDLKCYSGLEKKENPRAVIKRLEMTELPQQLLFLCWVCCRDVELSDTSLQDWL